MKKYLVNFKDVSGVVFEVFASECEFQELKENGSLVGFRKLSEGEMMEVDCHGW